MVKDNAPELEFAEISENYQLPIWEGLSAIFTSTSPERDEIFDIYCIHHFGKFNNSLRIFHTMYVNPDTSVSWYSNWENGDLNTYDDEFNAFLERWGFYYDGKLSVSFKITTDQYINMIPLADSIDMMDSIIFAERKLHVGSGNEIIYQKNGNDRHYSFSVGWGDCPSGCTAYHYWNFLVTEDCEVVFMGENGPEIPEWLKRNCNITSTTTSNNLSKSALKIFPNPINHFLNIEINNPENHLLNYEINDVLGNSLLNGRFINNTSIDTNDLINGIYFLVIRDGKNIVSVKKLLKK